MSFLDELRAALASNPDSILFEYKGREYSRGLVRQLGTKTISLLDKAGVPADARVGVVVRNRPLQASAMLGLVVEGRTLTNVYAMQADAAIADEVLESRFGAVIADSENWTPALEAAARTSGAAGIIVDHSNDSIKFVEGLEKVGAGPFSQIEGEPGLEILSSGTTGRPKRIVFPFRMLVRAVESISAGRTEGEPEPDILTWPYSGIGGMCNLVAGAMIGRRTTLLDKFNVPEWLEAIRKLRPAMLSGPPAVARMALDAEVSAKDLESVKYFFGGGAAFSPELQAEFERAYDLKVIWAYGATEFCGTIISWTPQLYETYRDSKMGAIGKPLPGISVRVVDTVTGEPLPAGDVGYLEAIVPAIGEHWIRTTDLAMVDSDGFVFHRGRGDGAIVRGGFKILPETIVSVLLDHPDVLDAAVVGVPDKRLGAVPVAAVELRAGAAESNAGVDETALREHARRHLVAHSIPTRVVIFDRLPRTTSLKPDLAAIKEICLQPADHL